MVKDSLGEHTVLRYRPPASAGSSVAWKPSDLQPGAKLNQPAPLFKKLDDSVAEDELRRLMEQTTTP